MSDVSGCDWLESLTPRGFERALQLQGEMRGEYMSERKKAQRRLGDDFQAAQAEVAPKYERILVGLGYRMENGVLCGPGVTVKPASRSAVPVSKPVAGGKATYYDLAAKVRELGRRCTPRQGMEWAVAHRYFPLDEIDASSVPGAWAIHFLEEAQAWPKEFSDHVGKLLARTEVEDKERLEDTGENVLASLAPLADGLNDPQGGGD